MTHQATTWIWQRPDWPRFTWQAAEIRPRVQTCWRDLGILLGRAGALTPANDQEGESRTGHAAAEHRRVLGSGQGPGAFQRINTMISCDLHDYIEIACTYRYPIRLTMKSGAVIQGVALDTAVNGQVK